MMAVVYVINPFSEIEGAKERGSFFEAFALAVTYFDYYSYLILRPHIPEEKLDKIFTRKKIEELFDRKLIKKETRNNMKEINELRNDLIHPKGDMTLKYKLTPEQKDLVNKTLDCIRELRSILGLENP
jgi:hypothetical protein